MQQFFSRYSANQNMAKRFSARAGFGPRSRRLASGFTLIEVMVALVIFVGGALAIVRIFPGALAVVQTSETRAIGTRMAQATLARFESQPFSIPEAIYDFDGAMPAAIGNFSDFNGAVVGTVSRNASLPRTAQRFDPLDLPSAAVTYNGNRSAVAQSALGRFRRIVGEKQRIRQIDGKLVVMTRFPYLPNSVTSPNNIAIYRDHKIEGLRINNANGNFDFSDATINDVPIGEPGDAQRPRLSYRATNLTYYVSYRYISGGRMQGVTDEAIRFASESPAAPVAVRQAGTGRQIVEGPVTAYLRELLLKPVAIPNDPNPVRGYLDLGTAVTPPVVTTDSVDINDTISVDYIVADWRWLVADDAPSTETDIAPATPDDVPRAMSLPSRFVLDEPNGTTTLYALLIGQNSANNTVRFYGEWVAGVQRDKFGESPGSPFPDRDRVQSINQKTGRVLLDVKDTPGTPLRAPRARVVYRNLDGWGHQVAVAAKNYSPYNPALTYDDNHPREPWREYFYNGSGDRFLYFHPSEAGKTVSVSYEYFDGTKHHTVTGAIVTINDVLTSTSALAGFPTGFNGNAYIATGLKPTDSVAVAQLSDLRGTLIGTGLATAARVTAITAVQGISVRARTAWFDGDSYSQVAVSGFRPVD
ncbi:MAG: hypothetical protein JWN98_1875 [Abditibacteriota bacterium]|nr:hypothetical protein [Abditibacteriota bacterium]